MSTDAAGLGKGRAVAFVLPALVLIAVFLIFPALRTIYLGLTDHRLTGLAAAEPQVVGLGNHASPTSAYPAGTHRSTCSCCCHAWVRAPT
ncbi:hypothetical protein [Nonomuraea sp. NPDC003709]|uniref:hypothetical protein n=1 Tax=Nonomuraea sp. NPDC003709 TaxID=3154450 RepID=UPI0033A4E383